MQQDNIWYLLYTIILIKYLRHHLIALKPLRVAELLTPIIFFLICIKRLAFSFIKTNLDAEDHLSAYRRISPLKEPPMSTIQMELLGSIEGSKNLMRAIEALQKGRPILLVDKEDRENEGDLVVAAEKIGEDSMNFLLKKGSGIVCLAMPNERLKELGLPLMVLENTLSSKTAFTLSIDAKDGISTGVSARDRAHTIQIAIADGTLASHLQKPGHVFPLAAKCAGVFERMGHTEGSVDLVKLAGLKPGAVLCELMNEDGSVAGMPERLKFAREFDVPIISIDEIFFHRIKNEPGIVLKTNNISTRFGRLFWHSFEFLNVTVDIFVKDHLKSEARLSIIDATKLKGRYLAQVLEPTDDDPLANALLKLKDGLNDVVALISVARPEVLENEQHIRTMAILCRALKELNAQSVVCETGQFSRVAAHFDMQAKKPDGPC